MQSTSRYTYLLRIRFLLGPALLSLLLVGVFESRADNLLVNSGFETNSGHVMPVGWARFAPPTAQSFGNYWVEVSNATVSSQSGPFYFKEWGACYNGTNNAAGLYQDVSSAPGSTYQASGWFYTSGDTLGADCYVWIEVEFMNANSNLLALYKSDNFTASVGLNQWFQFIVNHPCDISSPVSIGDPFFNTYAPTGTVTQLVAPPGTAFARYRFVYVQYASEGGSCYFDTAVLDQISGPIPPVVSSLFPQNMIFVNPADGLSFNVSSPSGFTINPSSIGLTLNGTDVSSSLQVSGSSSNKTVTYHGLQSNTVYNASITVTDAFNLTAGASTYFETTWVGTPPVLYLWEAEDFDFTNGMFYDFPTLGNQPGLANCYFGTVGVEGTDEHVLGISTYHLYRPDDAVGTAYSGDYSRKDHIVAGVNDYRIDPFVGGMWLNYTRDWSNGTYWVLGRVSTDIGFNGSLTLSVVNPDSTTTDLGTFSINGGKGWSSFENVMLMDTNGNIAAVTLNGKQTLRITSGGNLLANFFALVAGEVDLPALSNVYPTGKRAFETTNTFSFNVTTPGASLTNGSIKLVLDGSDVSAGLQITGTASTKSVVYPLLSVNALHTAILYITNSLGHGITVTNNFDTFSQTNYMVEAEDFDFGGGQYITDINWYPDAYSGMVATTNVDFQHSPIGGEAFPYRPNGIPQELAYDLPPRDQFIGQFDYHLAWYGPGDWVNYTRTYATNGYYIYARSAGFGPFSMSLDQVVSGAGTTSQTLHHLGVYAGVGKNNQTHQWVPLTDDSLVAPVSVKLGGQNTLRLSTSTGNCYPSYFMFVPAAGIKLGAAHIGGGSVQLSFPTQPGVTYRVFYRTDLANSTWTLLTTVLGDGTVKTVNDLPTGTQRYYKVTAP